MVTRVCEICGNEFQFEKHRYNNKRKLCDECRKSGTARNHYYAEVYNRKRPRKSRIDKIQQQAKKAGLSYGQYQAQKYMEATKIAEVKV